MKRNYHLILIMAVLVAVAAGCSRASKQPNILLITLDTTRADRLGCYGDTNAVTPNLDGLAARGVLFERAYTPIPFTLPAHASMLTGLYPPEHGIRLNGKNSLHPSIPLVTEDLKEAGYQTGAFVASFVLGRKFGLDRGFDVYDDSLKGAERTLLDIHQYRNGKLVVDSMLKWLESTDLRRPFFCWVHLYDPHTPYHAHRDRFGDAYLARPYDAEIRFMDQQIGRLLEFLEDQGISSRTAVIAVGDHGEGLGDHGELEHGMTLYASTTHVPLLLAPPGEDVAARRVSEQVSIRGIAATLRDLAGLTPGPGAAGPSVAAALEGLEVGEKSLYAETDEPFVTYGWSPLRSLIADRWKYIRTTRAELYDLEADLDEENNLQPQLRERSLDMEDRLTELEGAMVLGQTVTAHLTDRERQALESLGYLGGGGAPAASEHAGDLPDVKDRIHLASRISEAGRLMEEDAHDEALELMRSACAEEPGNLMFMSHLGRFLGLAERYEEAEALYLQILGREPGDIRAMVSLGTTRLARGNIPGAIEVYEEALSLEPQNPPLRSNLGVALLRAGALERAREELARAVALDPELVQGHVNLALVLEKQGEIEAARQHLDEVLRLEPFNEEAFRRRAALGSDAP